MKEGAYDFIQKPVDLEHLICWSQRASQQQELLRENLLLARNTRNDNGFRASWGEHKTMQDATQQVQRVAATDSTVLLLGKAERARSYSLAPFTIFPPECATFVALNCAAIPEASSKMNCSGTSAAPLRAPVPQSREDELATAARFSRRNRELPMATQAKLLRVLEERSFERVGGNATGGDRCAHSGCHQQGSCATAVAAKSFARISSSASPRARHDPPLRERGDDVSDAC